MVFICSFLAIFIVFVIFILVLTGGIIVFSADKAKKGDSELVIPKKTKTKVEPKPELKAYINLNGQLIELFTKAEEAKAKKDGFKVVYK